MTDKIPPLVTPQWLKSNLDRADVVVIDASWHAPDSENDAATEFKDGHVPGAVFFDIPEISDQNTPLPNMLPPADQFERQVSALGIGNNTHIIAYDSLGIFSAARAWWMFRYFGHDKISVLDGGLPAWLSFNLPTETGRGKPKPGGGFRASPRPHLLQQLSGVESQLKSKASQIIDFRSKERFDGVMPEPLPGVPSGNIPGSMNLHYKKLLQANQRIKGVEELKAMMNQMGINMDKPVIASCGSAISACVGALAFYTLGKEDVSVYDGSWAEWSQKSNN